MAKKIEEKYQQLSEIDHIIARSGMWVGSKALEESQRFLYDHNQERMQLMDVEHSPAMLKLFDEILSNSCDEYRRKDNMGLTEVKVTIDTKTGFITVEDNGGIPVVKHKQAKMYVPEFIFGQLRTSSNYDDTEDRNVIGTNGVGSSLVVVFSKRFNVQTSDGKNQMAVMWEDHMKTKRVEEPFSCAKHFTKIEYLVDFSLFDQASYNKDFAKICEKRCIDAAAANPKLKIQFKHTHGGEVITQSTWKFDSIKDYMALYQDYFDQSTVLEYKDKDKTVWVCPDSSVDVAFVNGAECSRGTHIRALRQMIGQAICEQLKKKHKIDVTSRAVDSKYGMFVVMDVLNPTYSSQTKEELTTPIESFYRDKSKKFTLTDDFLRKCQKSEIIELMVDWWKKKVEAEDSKTLRKLNREAGKGLKRSTKYVPCNSRIRRDKQLWIYEGDSAARGFRTARDPQTQAAYMMRGVVPNSLDMTPLQIMKNDVFNDLVSIIGLKFGKEFDLSDVNFGKIVISTDADVDGDRICALLLLFFAMNWPQLIEQNIICRSISPIIVAKKGRESRKFYTLEEFESQANRMKTWQVKYCKGLSGLDLQETKEMMRDPIFHYFTKDNQAEHMLKKWFGQDSNVRKELMNV